MGDATGSKRLGSRSRSSVLLSLMHASPLPKDFRGPLHSSPLRHKSPLPKDFGEGAFRSAWRSFPGDEAAFIPTQRRHTSTWVGVTVKSKFMVHTPVCSKGSGLWHVRQHALPERTISPEMCHPPRRSKAFKHQRWPGLIHTFIFLAVVACPPSSLV